MISAFLLQFIVMWGILVPCYVLFFTPQSCPTELPFFTLTETSAGYPEAGVLPQLSSDVVASERGQYEDSQGFLLTAPGQLLTWGLREMLSAHGVGPV